MQDELHIDFRHPVTDMPRNYLHRFKLRLARGDERRHIAAAEPPFITEEGLVLVDRRAACERRGSRKARKALRQAA